MSAPQHTPKPLTVGAALQGRYPAYSINSGGALVATVPITAQPAFGRCIDIAQRLADCWNACEGWTSPANMRAQAEQSIKDAVTIAELQRQRDALAEALGKIAYEPIGHAEASDRVVLADIVEIARAALAKLGPQS